MRTKTYIQMNGLPTAATEQEREAARESLRLMLDLASWDVVGLTCPSGGSPFAMGEVYCDGQRNAGRAVADLVFETNLMIHTIDGGHAGRMQLAGCFRQLAEAIEARACRESQASH